MRSKVAYKEDWLYGIFSIIIFLQYPQAPKGLLSKLRGKDIRYYNSCDNIAKTFKEKPQPMVYKHKQSFTIKKTRHVPNFLFRNSWTSWVQIFLANVCKYESLFAKLAISDQDPKDPLGSLQKGSCLKWQLLTTVSYVSCNLPFVCWAEGCTRRFPLRWSKEALTCGPVFFCLYATCGK